MSTMFEGLISGTRLALGLAVALPLIFAAGLQAMTNMRTLSDQPEKVIPGIFGGGAQDVVKWIRRRSKAANQSSAAKVVRIPSANIISRTDSRGGAEGG